jgi:hypothetical protein
MIPQQRRATKHCAAQPEASECIASHGSTVTRGDGPPHRFPFFPGTRHQQPDQPPPRPPARRMSPRLGRLLLPPRRAGGTSDVNAAAFPHTARYRSRRTVRRNAVAAGHRQACGAWRSRTAERQGARSVIDEVWWAGGGARHMEEGRTKTVWDALCDDSTH